MKKLKEMMLGILVIVTIIGAAGVAGTIETQYKKDMFVWTREGNELVLEDADGEQWVWEDTEHLFSEGDKVKVTMFTNYTDNTIYDDKILRIKRSK